MHAPDVVCLSHLPWAYGLERPHQVMRRFARDRHVFFVEEPVAAGTELRTVMRTVEAHVHVVSLTVPADMAAAEVKIAHRRCVTALAADATNPILWVYSPSSFQAAKDLDPGLLVYDCVLDHESEPGELELITRADLVFAAGNSLFEAKRGRNVSTYPLPSSVDAEHFAEPRSLASTVTNVRRKRVGFLGPIDRRVDLALVDQLAAARPDIQIVLLGGLVDVRASQLPDRPNVKWLGAVAYDDLPARIASWDIAIIPFHRAATTRRTEASGFLPCLAAGKPVVSTTLDELLPLDERGLVTIVDADRFVAGVSEALREAKDPVLAAFRQLACETFLARTSWDRTCRAMMQLVGEAVMTRKLARAGVILRADGAPCHGAAKAVDQIAEEHS